MPKRVNGAASSPNIDEATLLRGLNPEQRQAVLTTEGPLLVVAGAGSGKTSVLTRRIAYLIGVRNVPVHQILAITFTNKAAREMRERLMQLVGDKAQDLWMGTFHSIAVKILRREAERLGYTSSFTILDSDDQNNAIQQAMVDLNYDLKKFDARAIQSVISRWKNELRGPKQTVAAKHAKNLNEAIAADVYEIYQSRLFAANAMDFDDLIVNAVQLFEQHQDIRAHYQAKFQYVHVDEYQDTNLAQYRLIRLISDASRNICAVGDSDQAIYAWRGADISNILNFERDYPDATIITLETNYRSTSMILEAANAVIRNNTRRKEKNLRSVRGEGQPLVVCALTDGDDEARYVAEQIQRHVADGGAYGDCAVLYRANAQSRAIEEAFMAQAIPYTIVGGLTFYDRREIKDVFAYLRTLANPRDEISLLRVINTPKRGLGPGAVRKLLDFAHQEEVTLLEALGRGAEAGLAGDAAANAKQFHDTMVELMDWMEGMPVSEFLAEVLHATGYRAMYAESSKKEDQQRLENIDELFSVTQSFDKRRGGTLLEFLAEVSLLSDVDKEKGKPENAVRLMTLHASKGLEFPVVFLIGMEESIFPHARSLDDDQRLEEERNLCYVGITRAKDHLHLTYCTERTLYGQVSVREPSRFLAELPETHIQRLNLTNEVLYDWRPGDHIRHPQYGEGVVLSVREVPVQRAGEGQRDNPDAANAPVQTETHLEVMFHPSVGIKTFPKRYARPVKAQETASASL
ncbi:ATP-dependent helicase [Alicyclobacillus cycloheptanicus]|uniref:DNA 3'-5' helicase n=1 Tax=Alicyclobacillus cycloheptanicus TaxID=1457 RepID=A0ABT9XI45_9BACL|nr:UvrD-helicase domain-containing protein [Alicyclobacillus cycloheptanicus]MDQ0189982.1 DNA helicase-2/ATP-dependent DNA helicase PcrA [Alicyclobacillus cycloheptanicus]